ncbi:MAG: hypothetical protein ABEH88_00365 [Halobacteriales archaeon]
MVTAESTTLPLTLPTPRRIPCGQNNTGDPDWVRIGVTAVWHCQQSHLRQSVIGSVGTVYRDDRTPRAVDPEMTYNRPYEHPSDSHGRMLGGAANLKLPPLGIPPPTAEFIPNLHQSVVEALVSKIS